MARPKDSTTHEAERLRAHASWIMDDSAELIALAACSIEESVSRYIETVNALAHGRVAAPAPNEYANILHDMLAGREMLPGGKGDCDA